MPDVEVQLGGRSYNIRIGRGLAGDVRGLADSLRAEGRRCAFAFDESLASVQQPFIDEALGGLPAHRLPSGEPTKCFAQLERLCAFLAAQGLARDGVLFALGGGVAGDLCGYAAASYQRGIAFVQVPTTLLSMVDSSVGGKTGINIAAGKNLVGAFWQPLAVFADTAMLDTLPEREFAAGMGEVIKYGMLGDAELFAKLESLPRLCSRSQELPDIIARCCRIKAEVVAGDERETAKDNGRALLNLGHTFAHAVENAAGYGTYLHGEAVGLGLLMAAKLSVGMGLMPAAEIARVEKLLELYNLPTRLREPLPLAALEAAAGHDKKVRAGKLRYVVMDAIGSARTSAVQDAALIRRLWLEAGAQG
jgi:3-dehydroquinate synthase